MDLARIGVEWEPLAALRTNLCTEQQQMSGSGPGIRRTVEGTGMKKSLRWAVPVAALGIAGLGLALPGAASASTSDDLPGHAAARCR